jgi:hypothetical protein
MAVTVMPAATTMGHPTGTMNADCIASAGIG